MSHLRPLDMVRAPDRQELLTVTKIDSDGRVTVSWFWLGEEWRDVYSERVLRLVLASKLEYEED